jgi:SAM-dependent methyltransferase
VAAAAIEAAQIGADHLCLEPSAGTGALADLMPKERTRCVEISALHCAVLRAKGFDVVEADFILWADLQFPGGCHFDRVVMNPPFADGRAKLHTEYAYGLLKPGGRLVAILPASMRGKAFLPDCTTEWSRTYDNEFAGTSVSVTIMTVTKQ